jgi:hypothetical protein
MALLKTIELDSGIVVSYHRIVTITKVTNFRTILEVASYTSKEKREQEKQQLQNNEEVSVYTDTNFIMVNYDEDTTIKDWYAYLKTTEKYSGAEDDEDEEDEKDASVVKESEE